MPRISIRRTFIYTVALASCLFLAFHIHQHEIWARTIAQQTTGPELNSEQADVASILKNKRHPRRHQPIETSGENDILTAAAPSDRQTEKSLNDESALSTAHVTDGVPNGGHTEVVDWKPSEEKWWFLKNGNIRPEPSKRDRKTGKIVAELFPHQNEGDRIVNQLLFRPPVDGTENKDTPQKLKTIVLYQGPGAWNNMKMGRTVFQQQKCPVDTCVISGSSADAAFADAILFKDSFHKSNHPRPPHQVWILYLLECPLHTPFYKNKDVFNWTATYRQDSDIVAPYEKWQYYDKNVIGKIQSTNYAVNKTKKVAWFVSNCGARNNRLQYAQELSKHIEVDIFGACGPGKCPRASAAQCFEMLDKEYKFYLAFENSNCKDYITEKFYVNGLGNRVLPIVMGARPEDYQDSAPYKSFIHVDDFDSPKELASYLHKLDQNDHLYNEYFQWKGTGEFINTYFWCRLCAMLHSEYPKKYYPDVNEWWRSQGTCISGSWRKHRKLNAEAYND